MYIWILLATIMVALSFYNVSPRADKDHALNEVRAATVSNRFKIEHKAMLKTIECEIMYQKNYGCWDAETTPSTCEKECEAGVERASASGPVMVSCFNPMYYATHTGGESQYACTHPCVANGMQSFKGNPAPVTPEEDPENPVTVDPENPVEETEPVNASKALDDLVVENYNNFYKHVPHGYNTERGRSVFPTGIHHFVYCLDEVAERATQDNFVRCDMKVDASYDASKTTERKLSSRTRYMVTFAQIPDRWLSKKDLSPLPILVNMLAKDSDSDTVFGWTICDGTGAVDNPPRCKLYGINARHGNIRHKDDSRRAKGDNKGVSINIKTSSRTKKVNEEEGDWTYDEEGNLVYNDPTFNNDYVLEYEKLPDNSVFWANGDFIANCNSTPCMFAYERIPAIDSAYHCYNLMVGGEASGNAKSNKWSEKHKDKPINE